MKSRSACDHMDPPVTTRGAPKDCDHTLQACDHKNAAAYVDTSGPDTILALFRYLQPAEQKRVLDQLLNELHHTGFECTYCGRRIRKPVWLANLPLCRACHSLLFSPAEKRRMVYGVRR